MDYLIWSVFSYLKFQLSIYHEHKKPNCNFSVAQPLPYLYTWRRVWLCQAELKLHFKTDSEFCNWKLTLKMNSYGKLSFDISEQMVSEYINSVSKYKFQLQIKFRIIRIMQNLSLEAQISAHMGHKFCSQSDFQWVTGECLTNASVKSVSYNFLVWMINSTQGVELTWTNRSRVDLQVACKPALNFLSKNTNTWRTDDSAPNLNLEFYLKQSWFCHNERSRWSNMMFWVIRCLRSHLIVLQVMYFSSLFPYVVLFCFLVRSLLLEGSMDGIRHMFTPKVKQLSTQATVSLKGWCKNVEAERCVLFFNSFIVWILWVLESCREALCCHS